MKSSKPAVRSLGILSGVGSLIGILGIITQLREFIAANPDLVDDTKIAFIAVFTAVSTLLSIVGRWRASLPISGLFKEKR